MGDRSVSSALAMLEQELAATLEWARRKRRQPVSTVRLARDIVGERVQRNPRHGRCAFCGTATPWQTVCDAHTDLIDLDPTTFPVVTGNTTGTARPTYPGSASRARQEKNR